MSEQDTSWKEFLRIKSSRKTIRRRFRKIETSGLKHAHTFIIRRWANVIEVRRHMIGWVLLVGLLVVIVAWQTIDFSRLYTTQAPATGTSFSAGVSGTLDTLNPIFASSLAERSAAKLLFSGLLMYDTNNNLSGDLAESWKYEDGGKQLFVTLRPNLKWQDGEPIRASDIVYTVNMIKNVDNVDTKSPLNASWLTIGAKAVDDRTVQFILPTEYAPFLDLLTVGILPEHVLGSIAPSQLRSATFNRAPIGSGPFSFRDLKTIGSKNDHTILVLAANQNYHLGAPKISKFYLHVFSDNDGLRRSFMTDEINSAANLDVQSINQLSPSKRQNVVDSALNNGTYAFFRTDNPILQDVNVRKALRQGLDRQAIIKQLGYHVLQLEGPILPQQLKALGANIQDVKQPVFNKLAASTALDAAGWKLDKDGIRSKAGTRLELTLASAQSGDFPMIASEIAANWKAIGVNVKTELVNPNDLQQNIVSPRAYDVLISELTLGHDPDVYAYWDSSQVGPGDLKFNLSNYKSDIVDDALRSARSRLEPQLRAAKYTVFYKQWTDDAPAIALFQPELHYASSPAATTLQGRAIVDPVDRFSQVRDWSANKATVYETP